MQWFFVCSATVSFFAAQCFAAQFFPSDRVRTDRVCRGSGAGGLEQWCQSYIVAKSHCGKIFLWQSPVVAKSLVAKASRSKIPLSQNHPKSVCGFSGCGKVLIVGTSSCGKIPLRRNTPVTKQPLWQNSLCGKIQFLTKSHYSTIRRGNSTNYIDRNNSLLNEFRLLLVASFEQTYQVSGRWV